MKSRPALSPVAMSGEPFNNRPRFRYQSFPNQPVGDPEVLGNQVDGSFDVSPRRQQIHISDRTELELKCVR